MKLTSYTVTALASIAFASSQLVHLLALDSSGFESSFDGEFATSGINSHFLDPKAPIGEFELSDDGVLSRNRNGDTEYIGFILGTMGIGKVDPYKFKVQDLGLITWPKVVICDLGEKTRVVKSFLGRLPPAGCYDLKIRKIDVSKEN